MNPWQTPVDLRHVSRLLNHGPTVLVSVAHTGADGQRQRNVMAAAWSTPVEFTPPRIVVVIDKSTHTRRLVEAEGALALAVPCRAQVDLTTTVGQTSGLEVDKFERFGIEASDSPQLKQPWIDGCVAWMEARVIKDAATLAVQSAFDSFFVEVVGAAADPRVFVDGRWSFSADNEALHTLHHLGVGTYVTPGATVQGKLLG